MCIIECTLYIKISVDTIYFFESPLIDTLWYISLYTNIQTQNEETSIKERAMKDSTNVIPTTHHIHVSIEEIAHNKEMVSKEFLNCYNQLFFLNNQNVV